VARQQDSQPDEVALAKQRLAACGQDVDAAVGRVTKHAALIGVAATFGAGLLLSSGRLRPTMLRKAAFSIPKLIAYAKLGSSALATVNQILAQQRGASTTDRGDNR